MAVHKLNTALLPLHESARRFSILHPIPLLIHPLSLEGAALANV